MKSALAKLFVILTLLLILPSITSANGGDIHENEGDIQEPRIDNLIKTTSLWTVLIASLIIAILVLISIYTEKTEGKKLILFITITIVIIIPTLYLAGSTIYLNAISKTAGPVHWHADFEIWNCDEFINIEDPTGVSNRIGTPVLHEHNDFRIHIEGVLEKTSHADLHSFFEVMGGGLEQDELIVPTNQGPLQLKDGNLCNGKPGKLQIFLYRITNPSPAKRTGFLYEQIKLSPENYSKYVISPYANAPPGDCIIIEFAPEKTKTEFMCESYTVAFKNGDLKEA